MFHLDDSTVTLFVWIGCAIFLAICIAGLSICFYLSRLFDLIKEGAEMLIEQEKEEKKVLVGGTR